MPFCFQGEISSADVAFSAWGATPEELFIASASALLRTMVEEPEAVERQQQFTLHLEDAEFDLLLWGFLQELIFYKDARRLLLHADSVAIKEEGGTFHLKATVSGEVIAAERHRLLVDVKAVTLHRFQVVFTENLWKATVVLDV